MLDFRKIAGPQLRSPHIQCSKHLLSRIKPSVIRQSGNLWEFGASQSADIIRNNMVTISTETTAKTPIEDLARAALEEASANLGSDVVLLDTRNVSDFTDYFVIASGETERHLEMMADRIERKLRDVGSRRNNREGSGAGGWLLIDFPGFIVHLFNRETREFYDLEGLWSQAIEVVRLQ